MQAFATRPLRASKNLDLVRVAIRARREPPWNLMAVRV